MSRAVRHHVLDEGGHCHVFDEDPTYLHGGVVERVLVEVVRGDELEAHAGLGELVPARHEGLEDEACLVNGQVDVLQVGASFARVLGQRGDGHFQQVVGLAAVRPGQVAQDPVVPSALQPVPVHENRVDAQWLADRVLEVRAQRLQEAPRPELAVDVLGAAHPTRRLLVVRTGDDVGTAHPQLVQSCNIGLQPPADMRGSRRS